MKKDGSRFFALFMVGLVLGSIGTYILCYSLGSLKDSRIDTMLKKEKTPLWVKQNIDSINPCDIIVSNGITIVKVGNTYTATYCMPTSDIWYKVDEETNYGLTFDYRSEHIKYYPDSCSLKESLRRFIKLKMVEYTSEQIK